MKNENLKKTIIEVLNNQLRDNQPKCAKETFDRLVVLGYSENQAKGMICAVLVEEIRDVVKNQEAYNEENYAKKLCALPEYFNENHEQPGDNSKEEVIQETIISENKIGRNDVCSCGSGKKFKKCCGK